MLTTLPIFVKSAGKTYKNNSNFYKTDNFNKTDDFKTKQQNERSNRSN